MENAKKISSRSLVLMVVGAVILFGLGAMGIVQSSRAQLAFFSDPYVAGIVQTELGVELTENEKPVSGENQLMTTGGEMIPGKAYQEEISAQNETDMGEYVRITVRKYWETPDGAKDATVDPKLILLEPDDNSDWVLNPAESTDERLVFYYKHVLDPKAKANTPALSTITLDSDVLKKLGEGFEGRVALSAQVDSVQTSYAVDAAKSAWGVDVKALGLDWNEGSSR